MASSPVSGPAAGPALDTAPWPIRLNKGHPTPRLLPVDEIRAAIGGLPDETAVAMLKYPLGGGGDLAFRAALARFLGRRYGFPVAVEELVATSGISLSLAMVCQLFAATGELVVCSDPTYFLARDIFASARLKVHGIAIDRHGLRVDLLEAQLRAGLRPTLLYCIPSFHNPTGVNLAPARAERLVELAESHDFLVVADEPYTLLHFDAAPPPCMMSFDRGRGRVLSLGTFTKILAPGLRAGWVHGAPALIERFLGHGALVSGGALSPVAYAAIHRLLDNGFLDRNVDRLRAVYGERAQVLTRALREEIADTRFYEPRGGYFFWLRLGDRYDGSRLAEAARARGVEITPGSRCAIDRDLGQYVRLCFALYESDQLRRGVTRLAEAVRAVAHQSRERR